MSKSFSLRILLFISRRFGIASLCTLGFLFLSSDICLAQVTSDGTVNTQVNQNGNVTEITGGETRGGNLFHSFQDFSVGTGNEAAFLNANDIANIFSRVTGGNISNIDGLISANGSANLFLINPAGIIFGENARLDVGGSFYGSSADSILFEDGEFSATDLENPPVLTINAPIGLNLRDNPGDIVNRSIVQNSSQELVGLEVLPGNNLAFIGGNIKFDKGNLTARGGNIELGGLSAAGTVGINPDGSFSFPESISKADISLTNAADINTISTGGGNITVNARNLELTAGELNDSLIRTGISSESTSAEAQAGNININVAERLFLDGSRVSNEVATQGVGNAGNITIDTGSLEAINGGQVNASTFGEGNSGTIDFTATGDITIDGKGAVDFSSGILTGVETSGVGDAGDIKISTTNLNLINGGIIVASTFGKGNAGTVDITATKDITLTEVDSNNGSSYISSSVWEKAIGNAGDVKITTNNLNLTSGGLISANTDGQGNAGTIDIAATGDITLAGKSLDINSTSISTDIGSNGVGDAGGITISTTNLTLTNGGIVNADTLGQGNAGGINITATGDTTIAGGENSNSFSTGILSGVEGVGNAGGINISTTNLTVTDGGIVNANTLGIGDAGKINITATGDITLNGTTFDGQFISGIFSSVELGAVGNSGSINVTTTNLSISNGAAINAATFGEGDGGDIVVNASKSITLDGTNPDGFNSGIFNSVGTGAVGNSGNIELTTTNFSISNGAIINAGTFSEGNGGTITVNASESITLDGISSNGSSSGILNFVGTGAVGNAGSTELTTANLSLNNSAGILAFTQGNGDAGDLTFNISDRLTLEENSLISAQAFGTNTSGGNIVINAQDGFVVAFPNQNPGSGNDIVANSPAGIDGNIEIDAQGVFGLTERDAISLNNQLVNNTNDIDASGTFSSSVPIVYITSEVQDLPQIISSEQTTEQACQANREAAAKNGLIINGKGGIPAPPDQPLTSQNLLINGEITSASPIPEPIKTSQGKIQLARGIKITEDGQVILTAYRTNNAGERLPSGRINCGQI